MTSVLICEPNPHTKGTLIGVLESEGFEVIEARDIESARYHIIMKSPDFVLIDWLEFDIQHMDIVRFCQQVRRIRPNTIFIFTSHKGVQRDISSFEKMIKEHGADDYLIKPFNPTKLLEKLNSWQDKITN